MEASVDVQDNVANDQGTGRKWCPGSGGTTAEWLSTLSYEINEARYGGATRQANSKPRRSNTGFTAVAVTAPMAIGAGPWRHRWVSGNDTSCILKVDILKRKWINDWIKCDALMNSELEVRGVCEYMTVRMNWSVDWNMSILPTTTRWSIYNETKWNELLYQWNGMITNID